LERAKIGEEPPMVFIFFFISPIFIKFNKITGLQGNRQKMTKVCGDPLGDRPRGLLVSCWLKTWWEKSSIGKAFLKQLSAEVNGGAYIY
jgi:hypothetical protein